MGCKESKVQVKQGSGKNETLWQSKCRTMGNKVGKGPPFVAVRVNGRKRRVVSGPFMMAMMRSNKRYKPGD